LTAAATTGTAGVDATGSVDGLSARLAEKLIAAPSTSTAQPDATIAAVLHRTVISPACARLLTAAASDCTHA
jgi:hypothetical protein